MLPLVTMKTYLYWLTPAPRSAFGLLWRLSNE